MPLFLFLRVLQIVPHATRNTNRDNEGSPTAGHRHQRESSLLVVHFNSLSLSLPSDNSSLTRTAEASAMPSSEGRRTRPEPAAGSEGAKKRAGRGGRSLGELLVFFCSDGDGDMGSVEFRSKK